MSPPQRPDPSFRHPALHHQPWLVMPWQKANPQRPYQAPQTDSVPAPVPVTRGHNREWNGCEMTLVILGGILMFVGFLLPLSMLAGLFCFLVAMGLSAHRKT